MKRRDTGRIDKCFGCFGFSMHIHIRRVFISRHENESTFRIRIFNFKGVLWVFRCKFKNRFAHLRDPNALVGAWKQFKRIISKLNPNFARMMMMLNLDDTLLTDTSTSHSNFMVSECVCIVCAYLSWMEKHLIKLKKNIFSESHFVFGDHFPSLQSCYLRANSVIRIFSVQFRL